MAWQALVAPRKTVKDGAGRCLPYAQSFFGAPVRYDSAWDAWNATQYKHGAGEALPGVPVLLWFSHYGTYYSYSQGRSFYGNWGHVAIHVPGDAIYTSPGAGYGFERWANIAQIEARFNSKFVGWSEDINGLRVAQNVGSSTSTAPTTTASRKGTDMAFESIRRPDGTITFADELGIEGIDAYRTPDIGAAEYLSAFSKVFGGWQEVTAREFDIARAIADRRRAAIEKRQSDLVLSSLRAQNEAAIKSALEASLKNGVKIDAAQLAKDVAKTVNDDIAKRMAQ